MRRILVLGMFLVHEIAAFFGAIIFGMAAANDWNLGEIVALGDIPTLAILAMLGVLWSVLLVSLGLYSSRRLARRLDEVLLAAGATTAAAAGLTLAGALAELPFVEHDFIVAFWGAATTVIVGGRLTARYVLALLRKRGRNLRYVLIIGAGRRGRALARLIHDDPALGYRLCGMFDDPALLQDLPEDYHPRGDLDGLGPLLVQEPIDEVLITLPIRSNYDAIQRALQTCERLGVPARVFTDFFEMDAIKTGIERIGTSLTLRLYNGPSPGPRLALKRVLDLSVAATALVTLSPLLVLIAIAIRLDSPGPVLFPQTRVGRNKRPFRLYKFRTMVKDAEARLAELEKLNESDGPVFKIRHDPRVTRVGRFIRRYSLDELPQLFNVLRGEMSLVGPRPLPLRDVERFEQDWHSRRFSVRPGLTCSWVLFGRSELAFETWVKLDLDYIDNWSLRNDLLIALRTVPVVLKGSGAY